MICRSEYAAGKQFTILIAGRDHVFLWRLMHWQDVLIFVDDGVAYYQDAIIAHAINQLQQLIEPVVLAQCIEMFPNVRLENIDMAVD